MSDRKLGRGFDEIASQGEPSGTESSIFDLGDQVAYTESEIHEVAVDRIRPNQHQPRIRMDVAALEELVASVRENGILQPVLVRTAGDHFELIAGERRWSAAREVGLATVPVVVRNVDDAKALELAIIENIQREDLNPIDRALAYQDLIERFHVTQEEASKRLSVNRSTVANFLRLLELPQEIRDQVSTNRLSMGHARALLAAGSDELRLSLAQRVIDKGLSVRETERLAADVKTGLVDPKRTAPRRREKPHHIRDFESKLRRAVSGKVTITEGAKPGTGRMSIDFYSLDQFETIYNRLMASDPDQKADRGPAPAGFPSTSAASDNSQLPTM